jgi:hypothetical protein
VKGVNNAMTVALVGSADDEETIGDPIDDASISAQVKLALASHRSTSADDGGQDPECCGHPLRPGREPGGKGSRFQTYAGHQRREEREQQHDRQDLIVLRKSSDRPRRSIQSDTGASGRRGVFRERPRTWLIAISGNSR